MTRHPDYVGLCLYAFPETFINWARRVFAVGTNGSEHRHSPTQFKF